MDLLPIVDISRHQGAVNFATMRARGVAGVIIRVGHGQAIDDRFRTYWRDALDAGYTRDDLAVYTFINPKRGTANETADAMLEHIAGVVGDTRVGYMLDVEAYHRESPLPGTATLAGQAFADHIRAHRDRVLDQADRGAATFGYTNRGFWNGPSHRPGISWVGDPQLARDIEWIVPRYTPYPPAELIREAEAGRPARLNAWVAASPKPPDPAGWEAFARRHQPSGPIPPIGATWSGWQFSAGYNRQGARYGCSSSDLDLNVVDPVAWARWTAQTLPPPTVPLPVPTSEVPDMILVRNAETHTFTDGQVYPPRSVVWSLEAGEIRHVTATEFGAILAAHGLDKETQMPAGVRHCELSNAALDQLPRYTKPTGTAPGPLTVSLTGTAFPA